MSSRYIAGAVAALAVAAGSLQPAFGAGETGVIRYRATTTHMQPDGTTLRFDVLRWSDEQARAAVVQALEAEDVQDSLDDLPTVGYVWPDGSPVGYAVKYAHTTTSDAGERLTFVTSRPLGSYDFGGWTVDGAAPPAELEYSVIELDIGGSEPSGTASLAAPVSVDASAGTVALDRSAEPVTLFEGVHRLDLPY